jgi:hypothetical protein
VPKVPYLDPSQVTQESGLLGGQGLMPEHVLMAAAAMHDRGQLVEPTGKDTGLRMPGRVKGPSGRGRSK